MVKQGGGIREKVQEAQDSGVSSAAIDPSWADAVSQKGIDQAWAAFAEKLRQEERIALVATLAANQPELDGLVVNFPVNNPLQKEQMDGLRTELLMHLKTELRNASLELHLVLKEQDLEERKVFLSDRDRYDLMVEKNPALDVLRKALDLDLG